MNQEKIGQFIAYMRKEKNITQSTLAEKLGITDRAISKWENGKCMPDLSQFKPLCNELGISIEELINGEKEQKITNNSINKSNKISFILNILFWSIMLMIMLITKLNGMNAVIYLFTILVSLLITLFIIYNLPEKFSFIKDIFFDYEY